MDSKQKLTEKEVYWLLHDLCVKLGFCLPPTVARRITKNPPTTIDRFARVVYQAEGLDPALQSPLYGEVQKVVAEAFQQYLNSLSGN